MHITSRSRSPGNNLRWALLSFLHGGNDYMTGKLKREHSQCIHSSLFGWLFSAHRINRWSISSDRLCRYNITARDWRMWVSTHTYAWKIFVRSQAYCQLENLRSSNKLPGHSYFFKYQISLGILKRGCAPKRTYVLYLIKSIWRYVFILLYVERVLEQWWEIDLC